MGGNHTDHQRGHVLAASINLDVIAVVARRTDRTICVKSEGFPADVISLDELEPVTDRNPPQPSLSVVQLPGSSSTDVRWKPVLMHTPPRRSWQALVCPHQQLLRFCWEISVMPCMPKIGSHR
ncbi:MAG: galactokinase family protein [Ruminococcus callidus]